MQEKPKLLSFLMIDNKIRYPNKDTYDTTYGERQMWKLLVELLKPGSLSCGHACYWNEIFGFLPAVDCPVHGIMFKKDVD